MAKLIYSAVTSLDGYVADENGTFDCAEPDEELHGVRVNLELLDQRSFRSGVIHLHYRTED